MTMPRTDALLRRIERLRNALRTRIGGTLLVVALAASAAGISAAQAEGSEYRPFDFVARHILGTERDPRIEALDARGFTDYMKQSFLAHGRDGGLKAFDGCATPVAAGRTYHLDPERGDWSGDGSQARPLPGLAEFLKNRSRPDLKGGARLVLMSGDHGRIAVPKLGNAGFITIEAARGASPTVLGLQIDAAERLIFRGLTFASARSGKSSGWMVRIGSKASQIAFEDNRFTTKGDLTGWGDADWIERSALGILSQGRCLSVVGNEFEDLHTGMRSSGERAYIAGNRFQGIVNDNIDHSRSHQSIIGNVILTGRNNPLNKMHSDAIQGWTERGATNEDIRIDGNLILHFQPMRANPKADAKGRVNEKVKHAVGAYRQGITIYDGTWKDVAITGNVVVTNSIEGISMLGVSNSRISDNVVLSSDPRNFAARLAVVRGKKGESITNTVAARNLVDVLKLSDGVRTNGNIALSKIIDVPPKGPQKSVASVSSDQKQGAADKASAAFLPNGIDGPRDLYDIRRRQP